MRLLTERQVQLGAWSPLHDWERRPGQIIDRGEELSVCYWHSLTVLDRNFEKTNVLTLQQLKSPGRPNQKDIFFFFDEVQGVFATKPMSSVRPFLLCVLCQLD